MRTVQQFFRRTSWLVGALVWTFSAMAADWQPNALSVQIIGTATSCNGTSDGQAVPIVSGGKAPYQFLWSAGVAMPTDSVAAQLAAGQYQVTVTDANGSTATALVVITEPNAIQLFVSSTNINCHGQTTGSATVSASGAVSPYSYFWNTSPPQTTSQINQLSAGTYRVTITDGAGCQTDTAVVIAQPAAPMSLQVNTTSVRCFGQNNGAVQLVTTGGTPLGNGEYLYAWQNGMSNKSFLVNMGAGFYAVTVTDSKGCTVVDTVEIQQPAAISLLLTQTPSSCYGGKDGKAKVVASGGTPFVNNPTYLFTWNTVPTQLGNAANGLVGGQTYSVIAKDVNGCSAGGSIQIGHPSALVVSTSVTNTACFGMASGQASLLVKGGTPAYNFHWSNAAQTATIQQLSAGTYQVTVTDAQGCTTATSATVGSPNPLEVFIEKQDVLCKGTATGRIKVFAAGGVPGYGFQWQGASGNDNLVTGLSAGNYAFTMTDANGCQYADSVAIAEPATSLELSNFKVTNVSCFGSANGIIEITANGGAKPYQYSLNGLVFYDANPFIALAAGEYTAWVKDNNGCAFSKNVTIQQPDEIIVDLGADVVLRTDRKITLTATVQNGVLPYFYEWSPVDSFISCATCPSVVVKGLQEHTTYRVVVTDAKGCKGQDEVRVRVSRQQEVFVASAFSPNRDGANDYLFVQSSEDVELVRSFVVYSRTGGKVFEGVDLLPNVPEQGWDGKFNTTSAVELGNSYVWQAEVLFKDGSIRTFKGNSYLVK